MRKRKMGPASSIWRRSTLGSVGYGFAHYVASKAASSAFTRALAAISRRRHHGERHCAGLTRRRHAGAFAARGLRDDEDEFLSVAQMQAIKRVEGAGPIWSARFV